MKKNNIIINLILILTLICIFLYMLYINIHTHKYHDEFVYTFIYGSTEKCKNIIDIIISLKNIYLMHNGRIISTGIMCILLMLPKIISDILNSIFFTLLIFNIYKYSSYKENKINALLNLLLLFPMLWITIPEFNGTVTWFSGAVNYLWSTVFMLFYLKFYINHFLSNLKYTKFQICFLCLLSLIIGSLHESIGIITTSFLFFLFLYELIKNKKINYCYIFSCLLSFIGFLTIILSPGNKIRLLATTSGQGVNYYDSFFASIKMLKLTFTNNPLLFISLLFFIIIFLIKNIFEMKYKIKSSLSNLINNKYFVVNIIFLASGLLVYAGMAFSPTFAERVTFAPYILFVLSFFGFLYLTVQKNLFKYFFKTLLIFCFLIQATPSIYQTTNLIKKYFDEWFVRDNFIQYEKNLGKKDIQVSKFTTPLNSKMYGGDISISTSYNHNGSMAMYYNLNSIRIAKKFYIDITFCNLCQEDNLSTFTLSNELESQTETISLLPKYVLDNQAPFKKEKHSSIGGNITLHYGIDTMDNLKLFINSKNNNISLYCIKIYDYKNLNCELYACDIVNKIKTFHNLNLNCGKDSIDLTIFSNNPYIEFCF